MKNPINAGWIVKPQQNRSIIYETDSVGRLSGVREGRMKKLAEAGITQVFQLAAIGATEEEVKQSIKEIASQSKLTPSLIQNLHHQALQVEHGEPPQEVNHLLSENPYELRYGDDWKK